MTRFAAFMMVALLLTPAARAEPPLVLDGDLIQGGLVEGRTTPGAEVRLDGTKVPVAGDGRFLLGFGRTAKPEARLEVRPPGGAAVARVLTIEQRTYAEQRINGLPTRKVTPNADDLKRIGEEQAIINRARAVYSAAPAFDSGFVWPAQGPISGVYGTARFLNGEPRQPHYGVDVAAPTGTPVTAPADGTVTMAHPDMFFTGMTIIIDHGWGLNSTFLHLSEIAVAEGQTVRQGDPIGRIGATGRVTGPHLDWRINLRDQRLDPALLVGPMPATAKAE